MIQKISIRTIGTCRVWEGIRPIREVSAANFRGYSFPPVAIRNHNTTMIWRAPSDLLRTCLIAAMSVLVEERTLISVTFLLLPSCSGPFFRPIFQISLHGSHLRGGCRAASNISFFPTAQCFFMIYLQVIDQSRPSPDYLGSVNWFFGNFFPHFLAETVFRAIPPKNGAFFSS